MKHLLGGVQNATAGFPSGFLRLSHHRSPRCDADQPAAVFTYMLGCMYYPPRSLAIQTRASRTWSRAQPDALFLYPGTGFSKLSGSLAYGQEDHPRPGRRTAAGGIARQHQDVAVPDHVRAGRQFRAAAGDSHHRRSDAGYLAADVDGRRLTRPGSGRHARRRGGGHGQAHRLRIRGKRAGWRAAGGTRQRRRAGSTALGRRQRRPDPRQPGPCPRSARQKMVSQADLDSAEAQAKQADAQIDNIRAVIERRRSARPSPAAPASARSTSASFSTPAPPSSRCNRSIRCT